MILESGNKKHWHIFISGSIMLLQVIVLLPIKDSDKGISLKQSHPKIQLITIKDKKGRAFF